MDISIGGSSPASIRDTSLEKPSLRYRIPLLPIALASFLLLMPWPAIWESIYGASLEDRRVYTLQIERKYLSFDVMEYDSPLSYITDEYAWGALLNLLSRVLDLPIDTVFFTISFLIVSTAILLVRRNAPDVYLFLLVNPMFIDFAFSQMRLGLGVAIATWAYLLRSKSRWVLPTRILLLIFSACVHTSVGLFIAVFMASRFIASRTRGTDPFVSYALSIALGIWAALILGPWRNSILSAVDDRRSVVEYGSSSMKFFVIWIFIAILLSADWGRQQPTLTRVVSLVAIITVVAGVPLDAYANRVLVTALPFLVSMIATLEAKLRVFGIVAYWGYLIIHWFYWLDLFG